MLTFVDSTEEERLGDDNNTRLQELSTVNINKRWAERSGAQRRCFDTQTACENEVRGCYRTRVTTLLFDYRESAEVSPVQDERFEH